MISVNVKLDLTRLEYARGSGLNLAIRKAINKAGSPVKAAVVAAAPSDGSGLLRKSIRIKTKYYARNKVWACIVGPSNSFKGTKKSTNGKRRKRKKGQKGLQVRPARYAHFTQWGSKHIRGKHWLESALGRSHGQYTSVLTSTLKASLPEIFGK